MFISTYCIKFWNVKFVWHLKCFCIHISDVWFFVEPTKNRTLFMDVPFPNCFLKNEVWRTFKVDFSLRDHPFKTSSNFTQFLTPPHALFYYYPSANLINSWPILIKKWWRLKWMVFKLFKPKQKLVDKLLDTKQ